MQEKDDIIYKKRSYFSIYKSAIITLAVMVVVLLLFLGYMFYIEG